MRPSPLSGPSSRCSDVPQHTGCASVEPPTAWFVARYFIQPAGAPGSYSRASTTLTSDLTLNRGLFGTREFSKIGAAGRIRTSDRLVRSQVLYPAELQPRIQNSYFRFNPRQRIIRACGPHPFGAVVALLRRSSAHWVCFGRTSDRLVRSQVLYPAGRRSGELQPRIQLLFCLPHSIMAEREGFEPSVRLLVRLLSRELVSATHPPLLENGAYTTIIFLFS